MYQDNSAKSNNPNRDQFIDHAVRVFCASNHTPIILPAFNAEMIKLFIDENLEQFKKFCIAKAMGQTNAKAIFASLSADPHIPHRTAPVDRREFSHPANGVDIDPPSETYGFGRVYKGEIL